MGPEFDSRPEHPGGDSSLSYGTVKCTLYIYTVHCTLYNDADEEELFRILVSSQWEVTPSKTKTHKKNNIQKVYRKLSETDTVLSDLSSTELYFPKRRKIRSQHSLHKYGYSEVSPFTKTLTISRLLYCINTRKC